MKNHFTSFAKTTFSLFAITLMLSACKKEYNTEPIEATAIGFVHASPGTGPLDFAMDNQRIGSFSYTKDLGYYIAYPGSRFIGIVKKDSSRYITTLTANLKPGKYYSAFIADTLKSTKILLVEDDLSSPETNKAKVRFINLSPGSAPLDLVIQNQSTPLFTSKAFKEYTNFSSIDPSDTYTFQVKESGSSTIKASLPTVKIEKGKIYTIWAKGLSSTTDSTKFGLSILTNK